MKPAFIFALFLFNVYGHAQEVSFRRHVLTHDFISEGVAVGDVNNDGKKDILAGGYWFMAPGWSRHEIMPARIYDPENEYSNSFINAVVDVNNDGWIDLLVVGFPGTGASWYENPGNRSGHWLQHQIYNKVSNESPAFVDVDNDGRLDLLCADPDDGQIIWLKSPANADKIWSKHLISEKHAPGTEIFSHGLGLGDINGDGRSDVIIREGWWEKPLKAEQPNWIFHPADLGDECSQMYSMDVDQDGDADVISASAHLSGIWWHEQKKSASEITWEQHVISYAFAESHAVALADINGDGHHDIVTGKRNLKRNTWKKNPGTHGPPLLYWFEFTPGKEPFWIPHQLDSTSGAGLNLVAEDMNADGLTDIVISNFKGVFLFENVLAPKSLK